MRSRSKILGGITLYALTFCSFGQEGNLLPKNGVIPDEKTAISMAVAIWNPMYGEELIAAEKPYSAVLNDGQWIVTSTHRPGIDGRRAILIIQKSDAKVIKVTHQPGLEMIVKVGRNGKAWTELLLNNDDATIKPIIYQDPVTANYFYVESDGRHITAFTPTGEILWHRNPFVDSGMEPYRCTKPVIRSIQRENNKIGIIFNSSQGGILDEKNGDFVFMGQD